MYKNTLCVTGMNWGKLYRVPVQDVTITTIDYGYNTGQLIRDSLNNFGKCSPFGQEEKSMCW